MLFEYTAMLWCKLWLFYVCICCAGCCKTAHTLILRQKMEVQDQESLGRWDGLGSRDASSRTAAMEHIRQEVMRKVEAIGPIPASTPVSPALGTLPNSDLNDILAHLLMLSRRCPFEDVKERCIQLLKAVQVGDSYSLYETWWASTRLS